MHTLNALLAGFGTALTLVNLGWALLGVTLGTVIGILPGIGPALTIALLLPVTAHLDPTAAFIMFAGLYYGAMYGSSTTSILLNTPGETGSIITAVEGHLMARQGRGAAAPRPCRAIKLPSMAVMMEPLSPGVFSRIEVVELPYMAP